MLVIPEETMNGVWFGLVAGGMIGWAAGLLAAALSQRKRR